MKSDSSSLCAKRLHTASRFQPYRSQSGDNKSLSSSPTCITRSKAMISDNASSTDGDSSFHTAMDHLLPMESIHAQSQSGNDGTKSMSIAPSFLLGNASVISQDASSSSPPCLIRQNVVILDSATPGVVDCSSPMQSICCDRPAEPVAVLVPCPLLDFCIPPGLKESIHKAVQYHVKKHAFQLEASLSNQIALGLVEAIDFTLNVIERPLAETHLVRRNSSVIVPAVTNFEPSSKLMPGTWEQSRSQL
ncbi:hypothetical protein PISMIDRAFT_15088 [Pisolithus microcarpus 441]|uniref:Unplaced genomic scaffold scaffold_143, whole genome shotgun sequence n=1 Tax=Pisolithus microcarpus 441 TaxID=765257 RepID=A0A0C9YTX0_9AGAM|nr:hypothetical protein BKA83DRAFT_15088 [Pisolithus microcarpus]KIK17454.1 hypothetical protein PISMIDRAFT_15088 [Pisolithus microcarpus 441]